MFALVRTGDSIHNLLAFEVSTLYTFTMKKEKLNQHLVEIFRAVDRLNHTLGNGKMPKLNKAQKIVLRSALITLDNIALEGLK